MMDGRVFNQELIVRVRMCAVLVLGAIVACGRVPAVPVELAVMQGKLFATYGAVGVRSITQDSSHKLELTLSDRRYRSKWNGFPDTAKRVAKYAVASLPADYQPDSITVKIVTSDLNLGIYRKTATSMATFALSEVQ